MKSEIVSTVWNVMNLSDNNFLSSNAIKQRVYHLSLLLFPILSTSLCYTPSALGQSVHWFSQLHQTCWVLLGKSTHPNRMEPYKSVVSLTTGLLVTLCHSSLALVSFFSHSLEWHFFLWPFSSKYSPTLLPIHKWHHYISLHRKSRLQCGTSL